MGSISEAPVWPSPGSGRAQPLEADGHRRVQVPPPAPARLGPEQGLGSSLAYGAPQGRGPAFLETLSA